MRRRQIWWILPAVVVLGAAIWSQIVSNVEQPKYMVVQSQGNIQIRDYGPMIVAEAEVSGGRKEAINQGFRIIADYIFGNNTSKKNVAMTAPVVQQQNEKIAMTTPVTQEGAAGQWKVRFVMPASYTMDTLPRPNNDAVNLSRVLKDSQRIGKMIHSRSLIRELDDVWKISIGSGCGAAGSP